MIKVIAFDYADVVSPSAFSKWLNDNLLPKDHRYGKYRKHAHKWDIGKMNLNKFYDVISDLTEIPKHLVWDKFYKNLNTDREVIEIIKELKKNHKVFLFSNYIGELLRIILKKQEITELFDEIIISSEHQLKKPDPLFFKILTNKANVENNEILFIDDRLENVEGAKKIGINAIQFINSQKLLSDLKELKVL